MIPSDDPRHAVVIIVPWQVKVCSTCGVFLRIDLLTCPICSGPIETYAPPLIDRIVRNAQA